MDLQKEINVSLDNKTVIIASDDFIPYPYIKKFIPYIKNSNIILLSEPVRYSRYTKILLNSFDIKKIKFTNLKNIEKYNNKCIYIFFFGKKNNKDKEQLLKLSRFILLNDQELVALSENGIDIDENSTIYQY